MRILVLGLLCAALMGASRNGALGAPGRLVTEATSPNSFSTFSPHTGGLATSAASLPGPSSSDGEPNERTAAWPFFRSHARPLYESYPVAAAQHPAVARIIVPERDATAYGSGTLVDVRDQYGLVITNWHVVSDSHGNVEVAFPGGFRSQARPLKVDSDWDLAALVIWRPPIAALKLASQPPRPGELLTIHGYGQGRYRIATGRCTNYYAPRPNYPLEMVELDVEARQGDSGGPIFNQRGELAGVLFGAGQGTTLGSFAPRVSTFLATLAPDIGQAKDQELIAVADRPAPNVGQSNHANTTSKAERPSSPWSSAHSAVTLQATQCAGEPALLKPPHDGLATSVASMANNNQSASSDAPSESMLTWHDLTRNGWYDSVKSALAFVGLVVVVVQFVKLVR